MVEAAKTTAYCWRNFWFVKSTFAVSLTAAESLSMVQDAASAQPLASEERGSRVEVVPGSVVPPVVLPFSQYFLASPTMSLHESVEALALGLGLEFELGVGLGGAA
jgi:hypothetical protein